MSAAQALSARYDDPEYRASAAARPSWAKIATPPTGAWCDECAQLQHETRGASGLRMPPRMRRSIPGHRELALKLCSRHGQAWKERDAADLPTDGQAVLREARGRLR
ncbi:hypothetical protein [Nocardia vaccinii]|uniref:hypothetical protein n=1 Tax=Nocardia vaccinii TaxID=1822 RepID=UPI00082D813D|nr:hypothetical protein [Nocardia vaccinii]